MNSDTGKVYTDPDEIAKAWQRGEKLVPISERAAKTIKAGRVSYSRELGNRRAKNRVKDKMQKASRKKNR